MALGVIEGDGATDRIAGRAWREYAPREARGDADRIGRWQGRQRRLAQAVLPDALHPLVPILARDIDAPIAIPTGRGLVPERAARLRVCCVRVLDPDDRLTPDERAFKRRALATLDQLSGRVAVTVAASGLALPAVGEPVAISATSAAVASWVADPAQLGFPQIGAVASSGASGPILELYPLPLPKPRR